MRRTSEVTGVFSCAAATASPSATTPSRAINLEVMESWRHSLDPRGQQTPRKRRPLDRRPHLELQDLFRARADEDTLYEIRNAQPISARGIRRGPKRTSTSRARQ